MNDAGEAHFLPARSRRFLWLLCLNGALLGLEGIIQRLEGSGRLLFLVRPNVNPGAETQFGPWAYRANAASFFNLLWPFCLGFWWTLHRSGGFRRNLHHVLLLAAAIMAACPIISTSRGGAMISAGILGLAVLFLWLADLFLAVSHKPDQRTRWLTYAVLLAFGISALWLGGHFGWKTLKPRMKQFSEGFSGREEMYENAKPMAKDYVWFGTGAGTFEPVFQLYRKDLETYWPAQLHNDWLETRITLGRVGLGMILLALVCVPARWFARGGIHGGRRFTILSWLALAGCLVHARFDFPFQIYSILLLFMTLCAVLITQTRRPR
jgi:O-antigen ligase